jgi:hypothetical protein
MMKKVMRVKVTWATDPPWTSCFESAAFEPVGLIVFDGKQGLHDEAGIVVHPWHNIMRIEVGGTCD